MAVMLHGRNDRFFFLIVEENVHSDAKHFVPLFLPCNKAAMLPLYRCT